MKTIYEILKAMGIEVPEDKKADFDKAWKENYRTKVEFDNAAKKRDEYKESLETVQGKLKDFEGVDLEDLKGQIQTLTADLQKERDARKNDEARFNLERTIESFMGEKKFVNSLTAESIRGKLLDELEKDSAKGKSIDDIFTSLISDKDGNQLPNILVDEEQDKANQNKAKFTTKFNKQGGDGSLTKEDFKKMTLDERTKLKREDPELYETLRK